MNKSLISHQFLENIHINSNPQYQLTIKRGLLAVFVMYLCQLLAGLAVSYGYKYAEELNASATQPDIKVIGVFSLLIGGLVVIGCAWTDIRRFGRGFLAQIGLEATNVNKKQIGGIVLLLLIITHFFAWCYRTLFLPLIGQEGIIGGGSQMFTHLRDTGSVYGLTGFMLLALLIGPIMEELVFRGYLQSALARKLPQWGAIIITSLIFMAGHGPMILWPMYFVFSAAWGLVYMYTKSLKVSIIFHILNNLFYTVIGIMGWDLLA